MTGPVILWLQQAFRLRDNAAIERALAAAKGAPGSGIVVLHGLASDHPLGSPRVNHFLMASALETLAGLEARGAVVRHIPASTDAPLAQQVCAYAQEARAVCVIADDPLTYMPKGNLRVAEQVLHAADILLDRVEANVVVPTALFGKAAYGAFSIRRHIQQESVARILARPRPLPRAFPRPDAPEPPGLPLSKCAPGMHDDGAAHQEPWVLGLAAGERAARRRLAAFTRDGLATYGDRRDAVAGGHHSGLSQDLHFGLISPADVARAVWGAKAPQARKDAFIEQLLVRRELSFNAARYLPTLRSTRALPAWAQKTLNEHAEDTREHVYTLREFERADTHDEVWNATQRELRERGCVHSYLRMYWGKKILEWTRKPADALVVMERLNGPWALDGRGATMWANHLWCLGLHDRPFGERPVFGKVRWMSEGGVRRKFDVAAYIAWTDGRYA